MLHDDPSHLVLTSYRFDVTFLPAGAMRVDCGGLIAGDERSLARKLVAAGFPDGRIVGGRAGRTDWHVGSLHAFAAMRLVERDRGFVLEKYRPHGRSVRKGVADHAIHDAAAAPRTPLGSHAGRP